LIGKAKSHLKNGRSSKKGIVYNQAGLCQTYSFHVLGKNQSSLYQPSVSKRNNNTLIKGFCFTKK
jgi:hypothetical protein